MNEGRPTYLDEHGVGHMPDHRDEIVMRSYICVLIERPPHGRNLGDVLLVQDGVRKVLPGWEMRAGEPFKQTLHSALNVILGLGIVLKNFWREPMGGRFYEAFTYRTRHGMRGDRAATGGSSVTPTEAPEFCHVILNVAHVELGERWEPDEGSSAIWVNWNDVNVSDVVQRQRGVLSDYKAERNGAYRL